MTQGDLSGQLSRPGQAVIRIGSPLRFGSPIPAYQTTPIEFPPHPTHCMTIHVCSVVSMTHSAPENTSQYRRFDTRYARELPGTYSRVKPQPLRNPRWVGWNTDLARSLDLPYEPDGDTLRICSGADPFPGSDPIAQKYAGHQFGAWNPDLGDGRGLLLGEWVDAKGNHWDFHLKGAGKTPYSRFGDGRAVLRSSIREFLASEALHALGIPTTRALALIGSDQPVQREKVETGAMLVRVAKSHIRFGHFEWFAHTGQIDKLGELLDYTLRHHFPEHLGSEQPVVDFYADVVERTARLMAHWMAYGFCHGVMNTDNMSILGDTFDYGPYAFLNATVPNFICNHTDVEGRYAFGRQPDIALWNLQALAQALISQADQQQLINALSGFAPAYNEHFMALLGERLGISNPSEDDQSLIGEWMQILVAEERDFHHGFRELADRSLTEWPQLDDNHTDRERFRAWRVKLAQRLAEEPDEGRPLARRRNPVSVLRTHLAQEVISAAEQGDNKPFEHYLAALKSPFDIRPEWAHWGEAPPRDQVAQPLSCSS